MTEPIAAETSVEGLMALVSELENEVYALGAGQFFTAKAYAARAAVYAYASRLASLAEPAPPSDADIRRIFLVNGFTIKYGEGDLKPYVYAAARPLLEAQRGAN